jgi:hypothetical protein
MAQDAPADLRSFRVPGEHAPAPIDVELLA